MRILKTLVMVLLIAFCTTLVYAQGAEEVTKKAKGASAKAYEHASDQAIFHRVSDWFATVGKSDEEKAKILAERRAKRMAAKAEKEAAKVERKAQKEASQVKKRSEKGAEEVQAGAKRAGKKVKKLLPGR